MPTRQEIYTEEPSRELTPPAARECYRCVALLAMFEQSSHAIGEYRCVFVSCFLTITV